MGHDGGAEHARGQDHGVRALEPRHDSTCGLPPIHIPDEQAC